MKCQHCNTWFTLHRCPNCGWRPRPVVQPGTPEETRRYWEQVYGTKVTTSSRAEHRARKRGG